MINIKYIQKRIKSGTAKKLALRLVLLSGFCSGAAPVSSQEIERVRWQVPTGAPTTVPGLDAIVHASKWLSEISNGHVTLRTYEPGELIPGFEVSSAVEKGTYPAGFTYTAYDQGSMPEASLFSYIPFYLGPIDYIAWHYSGGGEELLVDAYSKRNIHPILCGATGPQLGGWFTSPVSSIEDLKDLNFRIAGFGADVLSELGVNVSSISAAETYQALERGVVDAAKLGQPLVGLKFGFPEIARYYMVPDWAQPSTATHLMINKGKWNELAVPTRRLIEMSCKAATLYTLSETEFLQGKAIKAINEAGASPIQLSENDLTKLKEITDQVLSKNSENSAAFARVLRSQVEFSESYKKWSQQGYLPNKY